MASTSRKGVPTTKSILTSAMTLEGHEANIRSISYLPDGQRIISGSVDETVREWDLKAAKEIEEVRDVCGKNIWALAVSRDGRWVVTAGGYVDRPAEPKVREVETGNMKTLQGHSRYITCIDISADSRLLASGSWDETARIWNLETGKLVAGPFKSVNWVGAVRFSTDSKKLAINSYEGTSLEVWDVQKQKLDVRIGKHNRLGVTQHAPMLWTNNNVILAAFTFTDDYASTIYEFDASTLETVGIPFEGHTDELTGLALSSDSTLLASSSDDETIKLWAFESRQLLASFDIQNPITLVFSPDSRQFAYTTDIENDYKIYICNTPLDVLAQAGVHIPESQTSALKKSTLGDLLHSDATISEPMNKLKYHIIPYIDNDLNNVPKCGGGVDMGMLDLM